MTSYADNRRALLLQIEQTLRDFSSTSGSDFVGAFDLSDPIGMDMYRHTPIDTPHTRAVLETGKTILIVALNDDFEDRIKEKRPTHARRARLPGIVKACLFAELGVLYVSFKL